MNFLRKIFGLQDAIAENNRGIQLDKDGYHAEALPIFEKLVKEYPYWTSPMINLANVYMNMERYVKAEEILQKALDICKSPDNKIALLTGLGNSHYHRLNYKKALNYFKDAYTKAGPDYDLFYNMGLCYQYCADFERAKECLERARAIQKTEKSQVALSELTQYMHRDEKCREIVSSFKEKLIAKYNKIQLNKIEKPRREGEGDVFSEQIATLMNATRTDRPLVFFVGAGISFLPPSNLPMASEILKAIFYLLFELDKDDIFSILEINDKDSTTVYTKIAQKLFKQKIFPFEETFQELQNIIGLHVFSFVDILEKGKPNMHHYLLAQALNRGHTVVTTNFDNKIETAYMQLFSGEIPRRVVTDFEFQQAIDAKQFRGILAKIHGTLENYGSLALTKQGISATADRSMYRGDNIDKEKALTQLELTNSISSLSPPKDLFLENILRSSQVIFLGYSGSDIYDILPIITSNKSTRNIIWVSHESSNDQIPTVIREWNSEPNCTLIYPSNNEDEEWDITANISRYFAMRYGFNVQIFRETEAELGAVENFPLYAFYEWLENIGIRNGDGLAFLGTFYDVKGEYEIATKMYKKAEQLYAQHYEYNESRVLQMRVALADCLTSQGQKMEALKARLTLKQFIENQNRIHFYPSLYTSVLLQIANQWSETDKDLDAGLLFDSAMKLARKHGATNQAAFGLRVAANRYFKRKEYQEALRLYLTTLTMCTNSLGDSFGAALSSLGAAQCFKHFGDRYNAYHMIARARNFANQSGDDHLTYRVESDSFVVESYFEYNHKILKTLEEFKEEFRSLLSRNGITLERFFYLLVKKDFVVLDELIKTIDSLDMLSEKQINAVRWHKILIFDAREEYIEGIKLIDKILQNDPESPFWNYQRINASTKAGIMTQAQSSVEALQKRILEARLPIDRQREQLNSYMKNCCDEVGHEFDELLDCLTMMQCNKARQMLDMVRTNAVDALETKIVTDWFESLLLHRERESSKEAKILEGLVQISDDNMLFYCNLGIAYLSLNRLDEAEKSFQRAITLATGDYPRAVCYLGEVYALQNKTKDAQLMFDKGVALGASQNSLDSLSRVLKQSLQSF